MTCWVSSGALLLVVMAGAALCYPFRQDVGPRSVPSSHFRPRTLLSQASAQEFTPQLSVAGARPRAMKEDPSQADFAGVWAYGNEQPAASGAKHFPNMVLGEQPDLSVGVAESEVSGFLPPGQSSFVPIAPPPPPPPQQEFQPGELFRLEKTFEHGDYESEHETQGVPQQPRPLPIPLDGPTPDSVAPFPPDFFPPPISRRYVPYPFDYRFLTGQYPPGTATHFSSSFERGRNYNQDVHYEKYEEEEPVWPWAYSAGPPQNPGRGASDEGASTRASAATSGYYFPYNQPGEVQLPPRYYFPYNQPGEVQLPPRYYSTYNHAGQVKHQHPHYPKRVVR
ncbi:uncharacterized protein LOC144010933 [Festucalex cinctus]